MWFWNSVNKSRLKLCWIWLDPLIFFSLSASRIFAGLNLFIESAVQSEPSIWSTMQMVLLRWFPDFTFWVTLFLTFLHVKLRKLSTCISRTASHIFSPYRLRLRALKYRMNIVSVFSIRHFSSHLSNSYIIGAVGASRNQHSTRTDVSTTVARGMHICRPIKIWVPGRSNKTTLNRVKIEQFQLHKWSIEKDDLTKIVDVVILTQFTHSPRIIIFRTLCHLYKGFFPSVEPSTLGWKSLYTHNLVLLWCTCTLSRFKTSNEPSRGSSGCGNGSYSDPSHTAHSQLAAFEWTRILFMTPNKHKIAKEHIRLH